MRDDRVVKVILFECRDLVAMCNLVCNNKVPIMGNNFLSLVHIP